MVIDVQEYALSVYSKWLYCGLSHPLDGGFAFFITTNIMTCLTLVDDGVLQEWDIWHFRIPVVGIRSQLISTRQL